MKSGVRKARWVEWVFRHVRAAVHPGDRRARNDKLMRRKARPLVGLEHAIAKGVGFGELKVWRGVVRIDVLKPRVRRRTGRRGLRVTRHAHLISAIHLAIV